MSQIGLIWMMPPAIAYRSRRQRDIDEEGAGAVMGAIDAFNVMRWERMGAPRPVETHQDKAHREQEEGGC